MLLLGSLLITIFSLIKVLSSLLLTNLFSFFTFAILFGVLGLLFSFSILLEFKLLLLSKLLLLIFFFGSNTTISKFEFPLF